MYARFFKCPMRHPERFSRHPEACNAEGSREVA